LTKRGYSLIHASAIATDGQATMYSGRGGGGKTTIALEAVENYEFKYLGDNFIICKDGELLSFLSDLNMFGYNLRTSVWQGLSKSVQLRFALLQLLHRLSHGYIKIFTPVSPSRMFPHSLQNSATLVAFNSLLTGPEYSCAFIPRAEVISRTVSNQKLEFFSFVRHVELYGCLFADSELARHWERYEALLHQNLPDNIPYRQITMPEKISREVVGRVLGLQETHRSSDSVEDVKL
jgi:hypothetical protein